MKTCRSRAPTVIKRDLFLEGQLQRQQVLVRLKSSSYQRRLLLLEVDHVICQKSVGLKTSGSPREETRLLCRLCVELTKDKRDT